VYAYTNQTEKIKKYLFKFSGSVCVISSGVSCRTNEEVVLLFPLQKILKESRVKY
jgi:hypothetical protein